jgi:hypothetical protein
VTASPDGPDPLPDRREEPRDDDDQDHHPNGTLVSHPGYTGAFGQNDVAVVLEGDEAARRHLFGDDFPERAPQLRTFYECLLDTSPS